MKKVAIVGTSKTTRHYAPFKDESVDIWTLGANYKSSNAPRKTIHFELHDMEEGSKRWSEDYIQWLRSPDCTLIVQRQTIHCPTGEVYPLEEVEKTFTRNYWTCTIAYMIGLALHRGYKEISIFGCELAQDVEFMYQRPSVEYLVGYCDGKGIKLNIPATSDICKTAARYAFETIGGQGQREAVSMCRARMQELRGRIQQNQQQIGGLQHEAAVLQGAEEVHRWYSNMLPQFYEDKDEEIISPVYQALERTKAGSDGGVGAIPGEKLNPQGHG